MAIVLPINSTIEAASTAGKFTQQGGRVKEICEKKKMQVLWFTYMTCHFAWFCFVSFTHSFACSFILTLTQFIGWLIDWLVDSFIQSCIHSVIDWFIHSFSRSKGWMWGVELTGYSLMLINGPCGLDRHISWWTHRLVLGEGWEATHLAVGQGKG